MKNVLVSNLTFLNQNTPKRRKNKEIYQVTKISTYAKFEEKKQKNIVFMLGALIIYISIYIIKGWVQD